MNINKIDLNLLVYLDTLLRECNVTRAANQLSITQPAMSNGLKRLRNLLLFSCTLFFPRYFFQCLIFIYLYLLVYLYSTPPGHNVQGAVGITIPAGSRLLRLSFLLPFQLLLAFLAF